MKRIHTASVQIQERKAIRLLTPDELTHYSVLLVLGRERIYLLFTKSPVHGKSSKYHLVNVYIKNENLFCLAQRISKYQ